MIPDLPSYSNRHFIRQQRWQLIGLIALAYLLRLYHLNAQSMWFDETLSALFAWLPLDAAIQAMLQEGLHHSPLFYILLRPFAAGGFNEFCLRFLPAALGVLSVPLIAQIGRMIVGARIGMLAAILLVVSPFHGWYSQEARMYTLLIASALGAMAFFVRALRASRLKNWLGMAMFTAIGFNTHHFAFFIPLVQFMFIIVMLKRYHSLLRPWIGAQLLAGLSLIPWLVIVVNWGHFYFGSASNLPATALDLLQTFWNFSIGYTEYITPFVIVALSLFLLLLILGTRSTLRANDGWLLLLWAVVPPAMTFLISFRLPMYIDRYISLSLSPFLLLVANGISSVRPQQLRLATAGLSISAMLVGLGRVYYDTSVYDRADWRSVGAYLEANAKAGDVITTWNYQDMVPFMFYYHGVAPLKPLMIMNEVNSSTLPGSQTAAQKMWVVIPHPNQSTHLVGHCQPFDIEALRPPAAVREWRQQYQAKLNTVKEFSCIRVEVYE